MEQMKKQSRMQGSWVNWFRAMYSAEYAPSAAWGAGTFLLMVALWTTIGTGASAWANPLERLFSFTKVEADPEKTYEVTPQNGPWMIMACSFSGPRALEEARALVLELRSRYKLPAYIYKKEFDLGEEELPQRVDRYGRPVKLRYQRGDHREEVAVLVGDFASADDPAATATLQKVKYCRPKCLEISPDKPTTRNLAAWRLFSSLVDPDRQKMGPMRLAFLTTNPLLPREAFVPPGLDELVLKANEGVPYSLLDCPGKYTVQVATFTGKISIRPDEIERLKNERFDPEKSELVAAAQMAHKLAEALRMKGYEAYVFHDRYASVVTVGSFDWITRKLPDGSVEFNPEVRAIIEQFRGQVITEGPMAGGYAPKTLAGIPLDISPIPVQVPKRPIQTVLSQPRPQR
jgi:hypothetical protein